MTAKTPLESAEDKIFSALEAYDATGQVTPRVEFTDAEREAIHAAWLENIKAPKTPLQSAKYKIEEARLKAVAYKAVAYTVELTEEEAKAWHDHEIATIIMTPKLSVRMD